MREAEDIINSIKVKKL